MSFNPEFIASKLSTPLSSNSPITLEDVAKCKGQSQNFFARALNQLATRIKKGSFITDDTIKEIILNNKVGTAVDINTVFEHVRPGNDKVPHTPLHGLVTDLVDIFDKTSEKMLTKTELRGQTILDVNEFNQNVKSFKEESPKAASIALMSSINLFFSTKIFSNQPASTDTIEEVKRSRFQKFAGILLFPMSGSRVYDFIKEANQFAKDKGFERKEIDVITSTKWRKIEAWEKIHPDDAARMAEGKPPLRPTVVLFHPNAATGSDMELISRIYIRKGYNVLMPTMGGYPGSPGVRTSESSAYQDIEAIKRYLAQNGVTEVGFHGVSLGGALAIHAGASDNPVDTLKTSFVVADQTFSSAKAVAGNLAHNCYGKSFTGVAREIMDYALPKNVKIELPGGKTVYSNGLDSLSKMDDLKAKNIPIQFIASSHDQFMGSGEFDETKGFATDYAYEMSERYYGKDEAKAHVVRLSGKGHAIPINLLTDSSNSDQVNKETNQLKKLIKNGPPRSKDSYYKLGPLPRAITSERDVHSYEKNWANHPVALHIRHISFHLITKLPMVSTKTSEYYKFRAARVGAKIEMQRVRQERQSLFGDAWIEGGMNLSEKPETRHAIDTIYKEKIALRQELKRILQEEYPTTTFAETYIPSLNTEGICLARMFATAEGYLNLTSSENIETLLFSNASGTLQNEIEQGALAFEPWGAKPPKQSIFSFIENIQSHPATDLAKELPPLDSKRVETLQTLLTKDPIGNAILSGSLTNMLNYEVAKTHLLPTSLREEVDLNNQLGEMRIPPGMLYLFAATVDKLKTTDMWQHADGSINYPHLQTIMIKEVDTVFQQKYALAKTDEEKAYLVEKRREVIAEIKLAISINESSIGKPISDPIFNKVISEIKEDYWAKALAKHKGLTLNSSAPIMGSHLQFKDDAAYLENLDKLKEGFYFVSMELPQGRHAVSFIKEADGSGYILDPNNLQLKFKNIDEAKGLFNKLLATYPRPGSNSSTSSKLEIYKIEKSL